MYQQRFPMGSRVRVASHDKLEAFAHDWKFHHKLEPEQMNFAGFVAKVRNVGFYHGGDPLYELEGVAGIWHESCLEPTDELDPLDTFRSHPLA